MTDPNPPQEPLDIEQNKVVRRARANGCPCVWVWVDAGDGATNPSILLPFNELCPVHSLN